ncbi:MAG TPA: uridine kinase [Candidatus Acidoferrales bacterium]|nr:uridine kinase [Candidatus Acidoferrales bacterium]
MIIGICGGTGSGKTTITRRIIEAVAFSPAESSRKDAQSAGLHVVAPEQASRSVSILQQDNYYKDYPELSYEERVKVNFDHPDSMDTPLLVEHVRRLRAGQAVDSPIYDFANFQRSTETAKIEPRAAIIIEGILIFENKPLRELMDIKIFVDTDADLRFIRRLERDIRERGRTMEMVVEQYLATVRPMHTEFVEPSKRFADVIIPEGGYNEVGIDLVIQKIKSLVPPA